MTLKSIFEELAALAQSHRFAAYYEGVQTHLPDGRVVTVKIADTRKSDVPEGLRHSKHSYVTKVIAGDFTGFGYGEANSKILALQKSIAEGVERVLYFAVKGTSIGTQSSNGWAAHISEHDAQESAYFELLERDAVLTHWLCKKPMTEIEFATLPTAFRTWAQSDARSTQYSRLRVLVTNKGLLPAIVVVLQDESGRGVISCANGRSIEHAIFRALTECCRIAQIVTRPTLIRSSEELAVGTSNSDFSPEDHAAVYAHHLVVPSWLFGTEKSFQTAESAWRIAYREFRPESLGLRFQIVTKAPLVVGYATSNNIQNLFFGRTQDAASKGLLNLARLRSVMPDGDFNLLPHCVP